MLDNEQQKTLSLLVIAGDGPSLLGRDWLYHHNLEWHKVNHVCPFNSACKPICNSLPEVCKEVPEMLVTDNGSVFTSSEFESFLKNNGICHITSALYYPASNGLAERAVQTFKENVRKSSGESIEIRLSRFLLTYRTTPHSTTGT